MKVALLTYLLAPVVLVAAEYKCYWNRECSYNLFSAITPHDAVRGDIRDYPVLDGCEAISVWILSRHGNRNPGASSTAGMKEVATLKDDIIASYNAGTSQLCAQDIAELRNWSWNETLDISESYLTGIGYEELYSIGQRIRERYPQLLANGEESFYFRPTDEQRTVTSAIAFIHGFTDGTNLTLTMDGPYDRDDVLRPYKNCDVYQNDVSSIVDEQVEIFTNSTKYARVQNAVQKRLGISYQLSIDEVYYLYELCRFYRSWDSKLKSPWCAVFTDDDLMVLEYKDDVRHYYKNGYGYWTNPLLGGPVLNDLYKTFTSVTEGNSRALTTYFSHDTMLEMTYSALGLFKDPYVLNGENLSPRRLWRSSFMSSFASNIVAVLNRCQESGTSNFRVQFFINELVTDICPLSGCTWEEFQAKFQAFSSNLDFCSLD